MDTQKRRKIWAFAGQVRAALGLKTPLTIEMLEAAVSKLGGEIKDGPLLHEASIHRIDATRFIVARDPRTKPKTRLLFSLGHELGHLFVHMGFGNPEKWNGKTDFVESYARSGYDEEELEANEFAGALLMPEDEFMQVAAQGDLDYVAKIFNVSPDAALVRGRWLGVYSWV
jgi:predicted transcriptional regulator